MPKKKAKNKKPATKKKPAPKRKQQGSRRARRPIVKARKGPVQLWLPLQMSLGLVGGEAVAPPESPADNGDAHDEGEPTSRHAGDQSSLW